MSQDDKINRQVGELFNRYIRNNSNADDIGVLDPHLPDDPELLRSLGARCLEESRKAMHAGRHLDGRRFDILARQLQQRVDAKRN